ncbi:MAG: hypothetical protein A4E43_00434 [Methanosaeta sp. PtaB.Bin005]|nr:MAG: hypothetical protein A4E43_00434 [Methanosaeta sp. PtaB.Bin005]
MISSIEVQRNSDIAFLAMMVSISSFPVLGGLCSEYPAWTIRSMMRATLSRVSICAPPPTEASTEAQGLLCRMKATRRSDTGLFFRATHFLTLLASFETLSGMGTCFSICAPSISERLVAPIIRGSITPSNSGMATDQPTSLLDRPCTSSFHSSSVL